MNLSKNTLYHFYNQGNNREKIFYTRENKLFFLKKFRKHVEPTCDVLAYCLMPNHFHFLLYTSEKSIEEKRIGALQVQALNNGFRILLSSYAQAINKQEGRTGSLFRQKTKSKPLDCGSENYPLICFNYIHQNPLKAGLVEKMEDWEFSSFKDYAGLRNGTLCNNSLGIRLLNLSKDYFQGASYEKIKGDKLEGIFYRSEGSEPSDR